MMGTEIARSPENLSYNIKDPETGFSAGQINFFWDGVNGVYRPAPPGGVNLYSQAQGKGLYPAFLQELNKYIDLASTSTDPSATAPYAQKVWGKLGAPVENLLPIDEMLGDPRAFVLRRKK